MVHYFSPFHRLLHLSQKIRISPLHRLPAATSGDKSESIRGERSASRIRMALFVEFRTGPNIDRINFTVVNLQWRAEIKKTQIYGSDEVSKGSAHCSKLYIYRSTSFCSWFYRLRFQRFMAKSLNLNRF